MAKWPLRNRSDIAEKKKIENTRRGAYTILKDVEQHRAYSNIAVGNYLRRHKTPNAPFLRELVYGTVRQKLYLDWIISNFVKTPVAKLPTADRLLLRMALYQILFMDSVPDYAAVSETVDLAKGLAPGREKFINGVLRQYLRDREYVTYPPKEGDLVEYLSVKYSFAPWIVETWIKERGGTEGAEALLEMLNKTPTVCIRANTLITDGASLKTRLESAGFEAETDKDMPNLLFVKGEGLLASNLYRMGLFTVQDKGAQLVTDALGAKPGDMVLDVCAAPGGKTMAIAEDMKNMGRIVATDIYKRKLDLIENEAKRLGIKIIEDWSWDARVTDSEFVDAADRVLCDVPCSGLGTVRRRPEIKYKEFNEVEQLPQVQLDILKAASKYVKRGGTLVYSTCTIAKHENEDVVASFLSRENDFEIENQTLLLPEADASDGFFICKLRRRTRK